jgi:hypothetical protein
LPTIFLDFRNILIQFGFIAPEPRPAAAPFYRLQLQPGRKSAHPKAQSPGLVPVFEKPSRGSVKSIPLTPG